MDFSTYNDLSVEMAVDLVNTFEKFAGEDSLETPDDLEGFLDKYREDWHDSDWPSGPVSERDVRQTRKLRGELREVFNASDETEAARRLNSMLADVAATPRISLHGGSPHLHFETTSGGVSDWLGAATAMGLSTALVENGLNRFGVCSSSTCEDVYVDTSRNRSRKHCSTTCTTRENVAAHRARTRTVKG